MFENILAERLELCFRSALLVCVIPNRKKEEEEGKRGSLNVLTVADVRSMHKDQSCQVATRAAVSSPEQRVLCMQPAVKYLANLLILLNGIAAIAMF